MLTPLITPTVEWWYTTVPTMPHARLMDAARDNLRTALRFEQIAASMPCTLHGAVTYQAARERLAISNVAWAEVKRRDARTANRAADLIKTWDVRADGRIRATPNV